MSVKHYRQPTAAERAASKKRAEKEAKMKLDYELVRVKNCAELQQKGFIPRLFLGDWGLC